MKKIFVIFISVYLMMISSTQVFAQDNKIFSNIKIYNVNAMQYNVEADILDVGNVKEIEYRIWTTNNDVDDLENEFIPIQDNHIMFSINRDKHNYECGEYKIEIIVTNIDDISEIIKIDSVHFDQNICEINTINDHEAEPVEEGKTDNVESVELVEPEPIQAKAEIGNISLSDLQVIHFGGRYTVSANIDSTYAIDRVEFPTWSARNGQDDITWHQGLVNGNTVTYTVDMGYHNYETGTYYTHIYVYDKAGNKAFYEVPAQVIKDEKPVIKDVKVTNYAGHYTITATVTDDYAIDRVEFPTWSARNGQDDITWHQGLVNGNTVTYTVDMGYHNYETGTYYTHIYVYDKAGNKVFYEIPAQVIKDEKPVIKDVKVTNYAGHYTITATVTDDYAIDRVEFPTWSVKNGQDDITWHQGIVNGNTVTYTVDMGYHNYETGTYNTHIYAYDKAGNKAFYKVPAQVIKDEKPVIKDVKVTNYAGHYTITATVTDDYAIDRVEFPTWSAKNGQDDITWHKGLVNGNTVVYTVDMGYHNYETGAYYTHIYAYDKSGNKAFYALPKLEITNEAPEIKEVNISKYAGGYIINAKVIDDYGLGKIEFPTWTLKGWQNDITWLKGTVSGDTVTYQVSLKDYKFSEGEYITHIYAYDAAGALSTYLIDPITISDVLVNGFNTIDGETCYRKEDLTIATGFVDEGYDVYYFDSNTAWMVKGYKKINNKDFHFSSDGKLQKVSADIPYFNQKDSRWGNKVYGKWKFSSTGCVPTAGAMVFSFLSGYRTPDTVGDWAYKNGYLNKYSYGSTDTFWVRYSSTLGRYCKGNLTVDDAVREMKHGNFIVAAMNPGTFTNPGTTHQIVLYGIDEKNNVKVYDPYFTEHNGTYHISTIFNQKSTDSTDNQSGGPIFAIG